MTATVIELAPHMAPRDCRDCHFSSVRFGDTFCGIYDQYVHSERVAALDCPMFTENEQPSWRNVG